MRKHWPFMHEPLCRAMSRMVAVFAERPEDVTCRACLRLMGLR